MTRTQVMDPSIIREFESLSIEDLAEREEAAYAVWKAARLILRHKKLTQGLEPVVIE